MNAVIRRLPPEGTTLRQRLRSFAKSPGWRRGHSHALALNSGNPAPPSRGGSGTFYYPLSPSSFDALTIDPGVRLLDGPWSRALVAYACSLLTKGGALSVPVYGSDSVDKGHLTPGTLTSWLGQPAKLRGLPAIRGPSALATVTKSNDLLLTVDSTLSWYLRHAREVLRIHADASGKRDLVDAFGALPERLGREDDSLELPADAEALVRQQGYYVGGIAYKAPLLAHIIRNCVTSENDLAVTDIGGGYGLLVAELIADPNVPVTSGTVVDHSSVNQELAKHLRGWLSRQGHRPLDYVRTEVEKLTELPPADVMIAIGSLLYVPRPHLPRVLERMWRALRPGGALVVHENIKAPSYKRDYALMFEPSELDAHLGSLGHIRYFASTATVELRPNSVARASVFRVVAKAP